jgi:hypothetical protein
MALMKKPINAGMDEVNYPYFDDPDADPGKKQITVLDEAGNILSGASRQSNARNTKV